VVVFEGKLDCAACFREAVSFSHKQNACSVQSHNDVRQMKALRLANENHMALPDLCDALESFDHHRPIGDGLTFKNLINRVSKWIGPEDAKDEGGLRACKAGGGPINKLRKVKKKGGLELVLTRRLRLRPIQRGDRKRQ